MADADTAAAARGPMPLRVALIALWVVVLLLVGWLYVRNPGDAPFIADEPTLIAKALAANAAGHWETIGLTGTVGRPYGPVPTWLYQVLLTGGLGPEQMVAARAALMYLLTALGLMWIAAEARLSRWGVLALLASPYLVFYARQLWDNSLNIPLAAILMGATSSLVLRGRWWVLPAWALVAGLMLLVHPMSVALIVPMALWGAGGLARGIPDRLRRGGLGPWVVPTMSIAVAAVIVLGGMAAVPDYLAAARASTAPVKSTLSTGGGPAWAFAWLGFRNLTGLWFDYFFPKGYLQPWLAITATAIVGSVGLSTVGVAWAVRRGANRTPLILFAMGLSVVVAQMLLNAYTRTYGHPHYYNATWIGWGVMAWAGVSAVASARRSVGAVGALLITVWLGGAIAFNAGWQGLVHERSGSRYDLGAGVPRGYGPTITNQRAIAATPERYAAGSPVRLAQPTSQADVHHYHMFGFGFDVMRQWLKASAPASRPSARGYRPFRQLEFRYAVPSDPLAGRLELAEQK